MFVSESLHDGQRQERYRVFDIGRQNIALEHMRWHASMLMETLFSTSLAPYGTNLVFMVVVTFTYQIHCMELERNVAQLASFCLPVLNLTRN